MKNSLLQFSLSALGVFLFVAGPTACFKKAVGSSQDPAATCTDGKANGNESDIDCGGDACAACSDGAVCTDDGDCASTACVGQVCVVATCKNGSFDENESDIDCGGVCGPCVAGGTCGDRKDCASGVCEADACLAPTCADGVSNGDETAIDCGGSCAEACDALAACDAALCDSKVCADGTTCAQATCTDGTQNGGETGIDCGGTCSACGSAATCSDTEQNGNETGLNCGGSCDACAAYSGCLIDADCASGMCAAKVCALVGFTVELISPNGSISILSGDTIDFEADFLLAGLLVSPETITWTSDKAGLLGESRLISGVSLSAGVHVVTVRAVLDGREATAEVRVQVSDIAVQINHPSSGRTFVVNTSASFSGSAAVNKGTVVALVSGASTGTQRKASYVWTSDIDGELSTSDTFSIDTLSIGQHVITLKVTDDAVMNGTGLSASASIVLNVVAVDTPPQTEITVPATCPQSIDLGSTRTMTATATDAEDGALVGVWLDSMDGRAIIGNSITFGVDAALGKHTLTFVASDSAGAESRAVCDIWVNPVGGDVISPATSVNTAVQNAGLPTEYTWVGSVGDGNTWVGTTEGLAIIREAGTEVYDADALLGAGGATEILDVIAIDNTVFIATIDGLARCTFSATALTECTRVAESGALEYSAVAVAGNASSYVLTGARRGEGLYLSLVENGKAPVTKTFTEGNSNIPDNDLRALQFVGDTLYLGGDGGLCVINDPRDNLTKVDMTLCAGTVNSALDRIANNEIRALAYDGKYLWLGTDEGLVRFDPTTDSMVVYNEDMGLANDTVNDVVVDAQGVVWIATNKGVSRIEPLSGSITNLTGSDLGLDSNPKILSIFIDANGSKWFASEQDGLFQYLGN